MATLVVCIREGKGRGRLSKSGVSDFHIMLKMFLWVKYNKTGCKKRNISQEGT